jgi:hypothetical protein
VPWCLGGKFGGGVGTLQHSCLGQLDLLKLAVQCGLLRQRDFTVKILKMVPEIQAYNDTQMEAERAVCNLLATEIDRHLPEATNKIWHAHPVWFLDGNPVVGYSKLKGGIRLLFWSGRTFEEKGLKDEGTFKAAEARYTSVDQVDTTDLARWLGKARDIQWDYKNIVKRRGVLERLK